MGKSLPRRRGRGKSLGAVTRTVNSALSDRALKPTPPRAGPQLVPCLLLRNGEVCLPGPDGPIPARLPSGEPYDLFDIMDQLTPTFPWLYVADLDGLEENNPQLDYIQELSREMPLWVDSGVRKADQAIDVLVAGAQKAVLSGAYLRGPKELRRAWKLTTELVFEVETGVGPRSPVDPGWGSTDPIEIVRMAREVGVASVIVSPREAGPDWALVTALAAGGPTWVDGTFQPSDAARLAPAGAAGGIFHLDMVLATMGTER